MANTPSKKKTWQNLVTDVETTEWDLRILFNDLLTLRDHDADIKDWLGRVDRMFAEIKQLNYEMSLMKELNEVEE